MADKNKAKEIEMINGYFIHHKTLTYYLVSKRKDGKKRFKLNKEN